MEEQPSSDTQPLNQEATNSDINIRIKTMDQNEHSVCLATSSSVGELKVKIEEVNLHLIQIETQYTNQQVETHILRKTNERSTQAI